MFIPTTLDALLVEILTMRLTLVAHIDPQLLSNVTCQAVCLPPRCRMSSTNHGLALPLSFRGQAAEAFILVV